MTTPLKFRWPIFIALALLALAIRLPLLGERPMHTDESINAYLTGQLLTGEPFRYDPQDRHGPVLFLAAMSVAQLGGAKKFSDLTETELRLVPVIAGVLTVLLLGAGVEMFGLACVIAALLFAVAPLPVYYNRYFIHETFFAAATLGLILSGWRAMKFNSLVHAALAGLCAALMLASKETAVIHFAAMAGAVLAGWFLSARNHAPSTTVQPVADSKKKSRHSRSPKIIFTALAVFIFTGLMLFTWFGQNGHALTDLFHAVFRFAARAGGEGHEKPFWYYLSLLGGGFSGIGFLALSVTGIFYVARDINKSLGLTVLSIYGLLIFAAYSAIPYKTPWLALNFYLPLTILAGKAVKQLWQASKKVFPRGLLVCFFGAWVICIGWDTRERVFHQPAGEKNPYAYAHTGEDLLQLPARINELAQQNKISEPRIAIVAADAWPLPWYLRKFSRAGFWQPGQETGDADFFITTTDVDGKLAQRLKNFRPEFFGVRPGLLIILWSPPTFRHE